MRKQGALNPTCKNRLQVAASCLYFCRDASPEGGNHFPQPPMLSCPVSSIALARLVHVLGSNDSGRVKKSPDGLPGPKGLS